jgi:hypothetical protein
MTMVRVNNPVPELARIFELPVIDAYNLMVFVPHKDVPLTVKAAETALRDAFGCHPDKAAEIKDTLYRIHLFDHNLAAIGWFCRGVKAMLPPSTVPAFNN